MKQKIAMNFQLLGDSLTAGMAFAFQGTWFDFERHKGTEQVGLGHIFTEQASAFIQQFNQQVTKTDYLKEDISKVYLTSNVLARANLCIAHRNPSVLAEHVPHQMYAPDINTLDDIQSDMLFVALGTNDTQDFNTFAVETMLKLFRDSKASLFQLIGTLTIHDRNPELANKIRAGYAHLNNPEIAFPSLIPNFCMSKEENQICLNALKRISYTLSDHTLREYATAWETKQYWSKTPEEIIETLDKLLTRYIENQCIEKRGYGLTISIILPPTLTKPCIFANYHQTHERIIELREALTQYAQSKGLTIIDLDTSCKQTLTAHGDDNLHLTEAAYNTIEEQNIFNNIFKLALRSRINASIKSPDALKELDAILFNTSSLNKTPNKPTPASPRAMHGLFDEEWVPSESGIPAFYAKMGKN